MPQPAHRKSLQRVCLLFLFLLAVLSESRAVWAQADPTASLSSALSVFGGYTNSKSDYGRQRNSGGTAGVDFTHYFGWRLIPSFEVRGNDTNGPNIKQE